MAGVSRLVPRATESALDLDALEALRHALGPDRSAEVVEDALLRATERLVEIEASLEREDWGGIAGAACDLRGVSARIGMPALSSQAAALTDCCRRLDRVAAHAVARRVLRTGETALSLAPSPAML